MSISTLRQLERKFARTQGPAGASPSQAGTLGAALEQLLAAEIDRRVSERMQHEPSPKLRKVLDGFQPAKEPWRPVGEPFDPAAKPWHPEAFGDGAEPAQRQYIEPLKREQTAQRVAPAGNMDMTVVRGADERISMVHVGDRHLKVLRDGAGRIVGMREEA